ncbi:MAG: thioredoxin family protein [Bacteroidetes bacterium]|nr:thioredoxin family protein [Bacteroidota bacterium]
MKKTSILIIAFVLSTVFSFAQNRTITFNHGTFSEIQAQAKKENKLIFIDCYTVWCGPCKWMAKNTFTNDTVADFYNRNFINAKIDMEKGEGIEIAKKYEINAYPTLLYINGDGVQVHRICGAAPAKEFVEMGKDALSPDKQMAAFTKKFNDGKTSAAIAKTYFGMLSNACQSFSKESSKYFENVKKEELYNRANWEIIYSFVNDYNSNTFQTLEKEREAFAKLYTKDSVDAKIMDVYLNGMYNNMGKSNIKTYDEFKAKLRNLNIKSADKEILKADIQNDQRQQNWESYSNNAVLYIEQYNVNDAYELNSFAWTFYEMVDKKEKLEKAASWAKKAVEADNNYAYNDTHAAVLFKLGKKAEAQAAAEKAIELAKKEGTDASATLELLEKIKALK